MKDLDYIKQYTIMATILNLFLLIFCLSAFASQQEIIAKVISAEACGEGLTGMQAVANTINNRYKAWHKTPYQIVTAKNQYFGYTAKNRDKIFEDSACSIPALLLAKNIDKLKDITGGALYFRLEDEPIRKWHKTFTVKIGAHYFYR